MGVISSLLTVEQYAQLPEEETMRTELVEGEIVRVGNAGFVHERLKINCLNSLMRYTFANPIGKVTSETMFKLAENEGRIPDVCLLLNARVPAKAPEGPLEGAPELAFEVVSSETAEFLERKINLYLATGSRVVWIAYPLERTIRVCRSQGKPEYLREGQYLEEPDLLPGFCVLVDRFFDGI